MPTEDFRFPMALPGCSRDLGGLTDSLRCHWGHATVSPGPMAVPDVTSVPTGSGVWAHTSPLLSPWIT